MIDLRQCVRRPSRLLGRYVREILWISSDQPRTQTLLPETALTVVFRQTGSVSMKDRELPSAIVSGLQQATRNVKHGAASSFIVVRLTEIGAPAILHERADELYNRTAPLDSLLPAGDIDRIQDALSKSPDINSRMQHVERFLLHRLSASNQVLPQIEAAVSLIRRSNGRSSVTAISRAVGMSQSALERHFRIAVGASPKQLSRLARLQHVCKLWHAGNSLTEIAFAAGFTDQPHMVRDFQLFTGTSPEKFFRSNRPQSMPSFYK